jgi:predicted ABC-type ATPase
LTDSPRILVFAGPNGSGKSTVSSAWVRVGLYINADEIKKRRGCSDLKAAQEAECLRENCILNRRSFTFETVLSTDRNLKMLERAKVAGYHIESIFVLTANAELNVFRVKSRALGGGHDVPADKIRSRYVRALANIPKLRALSDTFMIVDNTDMPNVIFIKDDVSASIHPNRYWTATAIREITKGAH